MPERADLLPIAEASREFGLSLSTLYRHIAAGRLTAHTRAGGRVRTFLDRHELKKLLDPTPAPRRKR